ncbi:MAG: hypothetical protein HY801_13685, partial [Candidatus Lindowbacteria bacterium]|nr:hypothetical protein [Candidatus Lindowbacteria bacterium]
MELVTLLKTCWKRKWVIVAFTVILPLAALIVCLKMTKVYEAVAKVKILQFEDTQALLQKQIPEEWGQLDHVTGIPTFSQAEVLRSRMVVEPIIEKLDLRKRVTIIDRIVKAIGLLDEYPDELIRLDKLVEPGYIGAFLQRRQIYIEPIEDSDIIEVYGYSDVLEEARDMANEVAKSYVEQAGKLKQEKAREALEVISHNMAAAEENLRRTQDDLKRFQSTHNVVNLEGRINDIQGNQNNLENQYLSLSNDLLVRKSRLKELSEENLDAAEFQATLKSVEGYPHIQDIETQLMNLEANMSAMLTEKTAKHPAAVELQAQINGIKKQLLAEIQRLLESEIIELGKTREAVAANIQDVKAMLKNLAETNRQVEDLRRQVQTAEAFYLSLRTAQDSATTAAATSYSNATIITEAALPDPDDPYYPEPALYVILAVVIGLMFGFGMAFIVEFMDLSVKDIDDIKQTTDLPLLGAIPKTRGFRAPKLRKLDSPDKFTGAILEIKHNVVGRMRGKKVIAAASTLRGEGKTKLLSHLAIALAEQGNKV